MKALPLSDRILFTLSRRSANVRTLSQLLRADLETVRKTVWGLEEKGLVVRADEGPPILFRIASDVSIEYRPSRVIVGRSASPDEERPERRGAATHARCGAVTTRGTPCKLRAVAGDYCSYHAPAIEV